jgi:hypothetical protein
LEQPSADKESARPQFIFGLLGNGYRLSKRQRRIADAIGLAFVIPACALVILAKIGQVPAGLGMGSGAALMVAAIAAMKIYVSLAGIPQAKRPFAETFLANADHLPFFLIYLIPILIAVPVTLAGFDVIEKVVKDAVDPVGVLVFLGFVAALIGSLALGFWIKRKLAERSYEDIE